MLSGNNYENTLIVAMFMHLWIAVANDQYSLIE